MSASINSLLSTSEIPCDACGGPLAALTIQNGLRPNWREIRCLGCQNTGQIVISCDACGRSLAAITMQNGTPANWRKIRCLDCEDNADGVSLTLKDHNTGQTVTKKIALDRTVKALLMVEALVLFPNVAPSTNLDEYVVTIEKPHRVDLLHHSETLQERGVRENDTLTISPPSAVS